ncbi:aKG-HExxH-type peptide beta-hydroxylase [Streptomyces sp. NPDC020965]|uniref:aKG-HExxH-type peptide beta-hydroxylase n=1 Tax=Streptomyces sp. NPDC020965 TaxID=3365105 RepID=UPI00379A977F
MGAERIPFHRLTEESLRSIANGTAGTDELRLLRAAQRSRLLLVLRSLLSHADTVAPRTGPGVRAPSIESAWRSLVAVQEHDPAALDAVVADPSVMSWALRLLRRLKSRHGAGARPPSAPLWAEIGQFHSLAAAASLYAGIPTVVRVPAHRGMVWLPGSGIAGAVSRRRWSEAEIDVGCTGAVIRGELAELRLARVSSAGGGPALLVAAGGGSVIPVPVPVPVSVPVSVSVSDVEGLPVPLPPAPDAQWHPLPVLIASPDPRWETPVLRMDTLTPYRDFTVAPRAPAPMGERRLRLWRSRLSDAYTLLRRESPADATAVRELVGVLVPRSLPALRGALVASSSSPDAFGAIATSLPYDAVQTASVLVHETRHQQLNALLNLVPLLREPREPRAAGAAGASGAAGEPSGPDGPVAPPPLSYAPWRSDPRPPSGLLHGVFAFAGVAGFWRLHREQAVGPEALRAHFEFALFREQVAEGVAALLAGDALTTAGRLFAEEIAALVGGWRKEDVPAEPARVAAHYCAFRRAVWRLRHLEIAPADAERLAAAWRAGHAVPPRPGDGGAAVLPDAVSHPRLDAIRTDTLGPLARLRLSAPDLFPRARRAGDRVRRAECAAVAGETGRALRQYARWTAADPHDAEAWIGAALVLPEESRGPAATLVIERPEVVAGVHRAIVAAGGAPPDARALAAWLLTPGPAAAAAAAASASDDDAAVDADAAPGP